MEEAQFVAEANPILKFLNICFQNKDEKFVIEHLYSKTILISLIEVVTKETVKCPFEAFNLVSPKPTAKKTQRLLQYKNLIDKIFCFCINESDNSSSYVNKMNTLLDLNSRNSLDKINTKVLRDIKKDELANTQIVKVEDPKKF